MKKYILFVLILAISIHTNAQTYKLNQLITAPAISTDGNTINKNYWLKSDSPTVVKNRQYYLDKSKKRRNTGFGMLGAGTGLLVAGFLIGDRHNSSFSEAGVGLIMGGSGLLLTLGSIPFFISGSINKHKATLAISIQPYSSLVSSRSNKNSTGISLNVPIH